MTQATQTTLGEIKLAGDLTGTADAPLLANTGVTAGSYTFPTMTVDGKGRITQIQSGSDTDLTALIPAATKTSKGIVQVGDNIEVSTVTTQGFLTIGFGGTIVGSANTGLEYDPCRPYHVEIHASSGSKSLSIVSLPGGSTFNDIIAAINADMGYACASIVGGNIRLIPNGTGAGSYINIQNDCLFKYMTGYTGSNTSDFGTDKSTIYLKEASVSDYGVVKPGYGLTSVGGTLNFDTSIIPHASSSTLGTVKVGSGLTVSSGTISANLAGVTLPTATRTTAGVVKIGSGITVAGDGAISVVIPPATTSSTGIVQIGSHINVDNGGMISVPYATTSTVGLIKSGYGTTIDSEGALGIDTTALATSTTPGLVKIGTGLTATGGVISVDTTNLPAASKSAKGAVQVGANIDVVDGVISAPLATTTSKGVVKIDTSKGFIINASGQLSMSAASIFATTSQSGLIRVGTGLSVTNGVLSASMPDATTSSKGQVQIGTGVTVNSGVISVPAATTSTVGLVKIGSGLTVDGNGVLSADSVAVATASTAGTVKIGANINVAGDGTISVPAASSSVAGVVKLGSSLKLNNSNEVVINNDTLIKASNSTYGAVKIGSGLNVSNGVVSSPVASLTTLGTVKIGAGLKVSSDGEISLDTANGMASTTSYGAVKIGSGLTVSNGVVSAVFNQASASTLGLVKIGTGLTTENGFLKLKGGYPSTAISNAFTKGQYVKTALNSVTSAATTITPDLSSSNFLHYYLNDTATYTIANPTTSGVVNGQTVTYTGFWSLHVKVKAAKTVSVNWGSKYKIESSSMPTYTYDGSTDRVYVFSCIVVDADTILVKYEGRY